MLNQTLHLTKLLSILKEIYSDPLLAANLGFKGGTAVYLFYGLNRFSVDLDFDLLDSTNSDAVYSKIQGIVKKIGQVRETYQKQRTLFFLVSHEIKLRNIKVEISRRPAVSAYEIKNYLGIPMLVMKKEDMFAHKLVAVTERKKTAQRDFFDIWFFLKHDWDINEAIVKQRTGLALKDQIKQIIARTEHLHEKNILEGIGELIDEKTKAWVKSKLKSELLFLLKLRLDIIERNASAGAA